VWHLCCFGRMCWGHMYVNELIPIKKHSSVVDSSHDNYTDIRELKLHLRKIFRSMHQESRWSTSSIINGVCINATHTSDLDRSEIDLEPYQAICGQPETSLDRIRSNETSHLMRVYIPFLESIRKYLAILWIYHGSFEYRTRRNLEWRWGVGIDFNLKGIVNFKGASDMYNSRYNKRK
jgi:hypothetical protein